MSLSDSMTAKLSGLTDRYDEVAALLADPEVMGNRDQFTALSKEYAEIEPVIACFRKYESLTSELDDARTLAQDDDPEMRELAEEDVKRLTSEVEETEAELQLLLLPRDPNDSANVFLEIRAGTGGDEAAIFSGDLFRMYSKFEIISRISGQDVYSQLKFESGAHRVQRVPETETQGRIHTSACTVAVMPEVDEIESIDIDKKDIREDTFRASGAGGQHVNKTDSAIRLTHLPSGIVVECQDERSQHKNRARAMSLLKAKLLDVAQTEQQAEQAETRKSLVGSGDRSERIRTYNFPQSRVTDHRINLTLYKLDEVIEGDLDQVIQPLITENQADQLRHLGDSQ